MFASTWRTTLSVVLSAVLAWGTTSMPVGAAGPCDFPTQPGVYQIGEWSYDYQMLLQGSKSERRIGILKRRGAEVPGKAGDTIETPLGNFKFFANMWNRGWLNTLTYNTPVFAADAEKLAVVQGNEAFARDMFNRLRNKEGNQVFSPFSISTALAMTYAGARGNTEAEMAKALHFGADQARFHPAYSSVIRDLHGQGLPLDYQLYTANSLWGQKGARWLPEFLSTVQSNYGAGLHQVDFRKHHALARQLINTWVEDRTNQRIKELIKERHVTENTELVLTNALYFRATWSSPFNEKVTQQGYFFVKKDEPVKVPMMTQRASFRHIATPAFQALELPYEGNDLSMVLFLPREDLATVEEQLVKQPLERWLRNGKTELVDVRMPRFKVTSDFELAPELSALGMVSAFGSSADLSGMTGSKGLRISNVIHQAFIDVNEKGTEAAAATAVIVTRSGPGMPVQFTVDRPFLFVIRDNRLGNVLFMGRVTNPTG